VSIQFPEVSDHEGIKKYRATQKAMELQKLYNSLMLEEPDGGGKDGGGAGRRRREKDENNKYD
jgi:hypothetical protein